MNAPPAPSSAANELAMDLRDVAKVYRTGFRKRVEALRGVSMKVRRGEIYGLLGPNGAGKSTLVKSVMTVIRPTRAAGTVLGRPVGDKTTLARVGYLPESHRFPRYLTGRQVVEFFGGLQGLTRRDRRNRAATLLDRVGMTEWADTKITRYSKGMAQRVGLAQAMVADPDLVVLDEPTDGVDPVARREIRDVLVDLARRGTTVFINSHLLAELEQVCDRVGIMVGGQIHSEGTIDELALTRKYIELRAEDSAGVQPAWGELCRGLGLAEDAWSVEDGGLRLPHDDIAAAQPVIDAVRASGLYVVGVRRVRPSLEQLFMEAVEQSGQGHAAGSRA